ncbi:hypothetical protein ASPZODRAFT_147396 [Penicilliopsis zonata CBS 506.65]|uniref:Bulb-type lectin domain-containing protein n=1 Tax=Penicilliopsis zonata CBS 506.65 TaxID=1073090 RepID=A0A1L9S5H0_9EURO|nr:hypothetical protein ASPZODRAFT_147396 [Penicilliopsis zonata CBS 506.65]OJJ42411.1 hypothetical protein ASPZODRAFT_147396 [Penicilliopsis zonata CBS 506.65]
MSHNTLGNGEWLNVGQSLFSQDGSVELRMQSDGKIAVYWGGECRFQNTATQRNDIKGIIMQEDGNMVIYDHHQKPVWATNTGPGGPGDSTVICTVQNDGNVVLYKGTPIWSSNTHK